jgi:ribosomal protein S14
MPIIDMKEYLKTYREANPEYMKTYYQNNKDKFKAKHDCPLCGHKYAYCNKTHHMNSKTHLRALKQPINNV